MTEGQYTPVARPPMDLDEAHNFVEWAKGAQDELVRRVYDAYNRQAHLALGYSSWDEMCQGEGLGFYKLPRDKRAPAVVELKARGMSNRSIGAALGYSRETVAEDLGTRSKGGRNLPANDHESAVESDEAPKEKQENPTIGGIKLAGDRAEQRSRARGKILQARLLLEATDGAESEVWKLAHMAAERIKEIEDDQNQ